jgi:hypothetical protein
VSIFDLFQRIVSGFPDTLAVACEGRQVTYRELNLTANRTAFGLRALLRVVPWWVSFSIDPRKWLQDYMPRSLPRIGFRLENSTPPLVLARGSFSADSLSSTARMINLYDLCPTRNPADRR